MRKGSKIYSVFHFLCPKCHEGRFFISAPYRLKTTGDVEETCNKCGNNNMLEPGFYQGAMYVSYGLGVALFVGIWAGTSFFTPGMQSWLQISLVAISSIGLSPLLYSLSKIIYANIFIRYDMDAVAKHAKSIK
jgi:uncharacterized protein (DUF983 family)